MASLDVRPIDPPEGPQAPLPAPPARVVVGLVLVTVVVAAFSATIEWSRLDEVRDEVAIATAVDVARAGVPADQVSNCFQGFCFEDDVGFLQKWWEFSTTHLRLIWAGLVLAMIVGGIVDGFVTRSGGGPAFGTWRTIRLGTRARLSGASVVPVGGGDGVAAGVSVGALAGPAIAMSLVLFTPAVWGTRLALAGLAVAAVLFVTRGERSKPQLVAGPSLPAALGDSLRAAGRFALRLGPLFIAASFVGGLGPQFLTLEGVEAVAGAHVLGVVLAIAVGLLIDLPLTFGLPIASAALVIGVDPLVVGVLLVTLTAVGPLSLREIASVRPGAAVTLVVTLVVGAFAVFGSANAVIAATGGPRIAWDGEVCSYRGPARLGPGVHDFTVHNDDDDDGDGHTLAVVVGKLPDNVSLDHFEATVSADRAADLPVWFTVAGTREFVFPGKSEPMEITFHDPGTYAVVCLDGGGFYVIFEFSMPQPMGWFDEFRSTFQGHVAEETFQVAG